MRSRSVHGADFKERNNNEIKLTYIDEMNSLDLGPERAGQKYFQKVSQQDLNLHRLEAIRNRGVPQRERRSFTSRLRQ
jgi:hypothetical protein